MAIGTVTTFPINTIFEFADRDNFGMSSQLSAYVHQWMIDANRDAPVSEHAIRLGIDSALSAFTQYINLHEDELHWGTFDHTVGPSAHFKVLEPGYNANLIGDVGGRPLSGFYADPSLIMKLENNTITLSGVFHPEQVVLSSDFSVQGGKYQRTTVVRAEDLDGGEGLSGIKIFDVEEDEVIGKFFIKCTNSFNNEFENVAYSIGKGGWGSPNQEWYIRTFIAPVKTGILTLDDMHYGFGLSAEYDWIGPGDEKEIRMFRKSLMNCSKGEFAITMFYDKVQWTSNGYAWFLGDGNKLTTHRINFDNDVASNRGVKILDKKIRYICVNNRHLIYTTGGYWLKTNTNHSRVSRFNSKIDTAGIASRTNILHGRCSISASKSNTNGYFYGGAVYILKNPTPYMERIAFATDTIHGMGNLPRVAYGIYSHIFNSSYTWLIGGNHSDASINIFDFSTNTLGTRSNLNVPRNNEGGPSFNLTDIAYVLPGKIYTGHHMGGGNNNITRLYRNVPTTTIYNKITETQTDHNYMFPVNGGESLSCQSDTEGYYFPNRYFDGRNWFFPYQYQVVGQKLNFATNTTMVYSTDMNNIPFYGNGTSLM